VTRDYLKRAISVRTACPLARSVGVVTRDDCRELIALPPHIRRLRYPHLDEDLRGARRSASKHHVHRGSPALFRTGTGEHVTLVSLSCAARELAFRERVKIDVAFDASHDNSWPLAAALTERPALEHSPQGVTADARAPCHVVPVSQPIFAPVIRPRTGFGIPKVHFLYTSDRHSHGTGDSTSCRFDAVGRRRLKASALRHIRSGVVRLALGDLLLITCARSRDAVWGRLSACERLIPVRAARGNICVQSSYFVDRGAPRSFSSH
jgi:hypothetical protein